MTQPGQEGYVGSALDAVHLVINGEEVLVSTEYEVHQSILTQPSAFSLRFGYGGVVKDLIAKAPPRSTFQLKIGGTVRMTGFTDGYEVTQNGGATSLTVDGRDMLALVHDGFIQVEKSFAAHTYGQLVREALTFTGFFNFEADGPVQLSQQLIIGSNANDANRKLSVGIPVEAEIVSLEEFDKSEQLSPIDTDNVFRQCKAHVGERWYHFVKRNLDRGGLFIWAAANGDCILSRPNPKQEPAYRIIRHRDQPLNAVNSTSVNYKNKTTQRFSEAIVYGRYGGRKYGRAKAKGGFTDQEMVDLGYERTFVAHDTNVSNQTQAAFYASRKIAEFRRLGWQLTYTVAGHSTSAIGGGRAVWAPDTMVRVDDDELGLHGNYWIESVLFRRPPTSTTITLMRPEDLLFGLSE